MSRSTAVLRVLGLLPCALLVAVAAMAAPAPIYRAKPFTLWVTGWNRPVDALGDCRFDKEDDKLTITVPGAGHGFPGQVERLSAPHLLRDVEGDFSVEVRVGGRFEHKNPQNGQLRRGAGLLLSDGDKLVRFGRVVDENNVMVLGVFCPPMSGSTGDPSTVQNPTYLRIERRNNVLTLKHSTDRQKWTNPFEGHPAWNVPFAKKIQVGVFAESMAPGSFAPAFDQFVLTPSK